MSRVFGGVSTLPIHVVLPVLDRTYLPTVPEYLVFLLLTSYFSHALVVFFNLFQLLHGIIITRFCMHGVPGIK